MSRARKARGVLSIAFLVVFAAWIWLEPNRSESPVIALDCRSGTGSRAGCLACTSPCHRVAMAGLLVGHRDRSDWVLIASYPILPQVSAVGSFLLILMSLTTLSFLVTTPEAWVPALGASTHGFPYLSGTGRLIIKDAIMLGAAVVTLADSARAWMARNP